MNETQHHNAHTSPRLADVGCRKATIGTRHKAFAQVEAIALVIVVFVLIAILLATAPYGRRQGMLNRDLANLRQIGAWTFTFASDNQDLHPSFSSAPNTTYPDLLPLASGTPLRQAVGQAIDIVRRRTGRETFPVSNAWFPHSLYTHLVLADYADRPLPDPTFVSTGDKYRFNWLDDPINKHDQGFWQPYQNPASGSVSNSKLRWPYSASFQTPPAWFDKREVGSRIAQAGHGAFSVPSGPLGGQPLSDVTFPAQKVMMHDQGAWHFTKQARFFAYETSRTAVLMADAGAGTRLTADSNEGWAPNSPTASFPTKFNYTPRNWEPPFDPNVSNLVVGHYRWTRGGIKGRDFDGPEIDTGQK